MTLDVARFPEGFLIGAATAAHQVEGNNVNADLWDAEWTRHSKFAEPSRDACDSYHRYHEDIELLAAAGLDTYRFGVEWARIEPEEGAFSRAELDHYRRMAMTCGERGVTPMITLQHFTSPKWFARRGGWDGAQAADRFARYRRASGGAPRRPRAVGLHDQRGEPEGHGAMHRPISAPARGAPTTLVMNARPRWADSPTTTSR